MDCPNCEGVSLTMTERQGIEIDYCPRCRGVWLDRGELDKIIDRALETAPGRVEEREPSRDYPRQPDRSHDRHEHDRHDSHHGGYYKKKKREGFLSNLFDFD